ncbi:paired amphipathic helix [Earliella scabrosa]|nr:paired amphipathic helix [Earliella scabrosa]
MSAATEPQYNISGALRYLDTVKATFADSPESYDAFLQIMTDFRNEVIDVRGVADRIITLFEGHPDLIAGFNVYLPPGHRLEAGDDGRIVLRVPPLSAL